jgi:hypothetical protein
MSLSEPSARRLNLDPSKSQENPARTKALMKIKISAAIDIRPFFTEKDDNTSVA